MPLSTPLGGVGTPAVCLWMLQDELKQCRRSHDQENQKEETELDLLLDQLRQGSNEEVRTFCDHALLL